MHGLDMSCYLVPNNYLKVAYVPTTRLLLGKFLIVTRCIMTIVAATLQRAVKYRLQFSGRLWSIGCVIVVGGGRQGPPKG